MSEIFGVPLQQLAGQLLIGVINGAFYATLSLGLAVIFGLLGIVNFAHGAFYMMGAIGAWLLLEHFGIGYWPSLILAPLVVGSLGILIEWLVLRRIYKLDAIYGLLLTLGLALVLEGVFRQQYGTGGQPYVIPDELTGGQDLGFMFLPNYRLWVIFASIAICSGTLLMIEKTKLGMYLRATTENPMMVRAFGVRVSRLVTLTFGFGVALAAIGGVLAAPIYQVSPLMGSNIIIVVFAVVVIGGMGSISGAIVSGFGLGVVEGLTKVYYPAAASTVIFLVMVIVLLLKPAGLFGTNATPAKSALAEDALPAARQDMALWERMVGLTLLFLAVAAPFAGVYPGFLMKGLCFALFACAFNLLLGYVGLLSFGHAAFFGLSAYFTGYAMKVWGLTPELGLLVGLVNGVALGLIFGGLAIRRQGIYFAMITLALSQMVFFFCVQAAFTGGEDGLQNIPRGKLFGLFDLDRPLTLYFFVLGVFLLGFFILYRTIHSPFGQVLKAIRENESRAISLGYKTNQCKLLAFVISAAVTGMAGSTQAIAFRIAGLTDVHWMTSGEVVLMTLVGGVGTILGPIFGAVTLTLISGYMASFGAWVTVIQGAVFIACVLFFRAGMYGAIDRAMRAALSRKTHASASLRNNAAAR